MEKFLSDPAMLWPSTKLGFGNLVINFAQEPSNTECRVALRRPSLERATSNPTGKVLADFPHEIMLVAVKKVLKPEGSDMVLVHSRVSFPVGANYWLAHA